MSIDTAIRHVTRPGANLFLELGFPPKEARRLHGASRKQIREAKVLRRQLVSELAAWIEQQRLTQTEAAAMLMLPRPRVLDVMHKRISGFSIDILVDLLSRAGRPVRLASGR